MELTKETLGFFLAFLGVIAFSYFAIKLIGWRGYILSLGLTIVIISYIFLVIYLLNIN